MTYQAREESTHDGAPIECFVFTYGTQVWRITSADVPVTLPGIGTFAPEVISRGRRTFSSEDDSGGVEIHVSRSNPVAALFYGYPPGEPVYVSLYRAHRGEEADSRITLREAEVAGVRVEGSEAVLRCVSLVQQFEMAVPSLVYQGSCNHILYDGGCKVLREAFTDQVSLASASGLDVVSADFALRPDGWYTRGRLILATNESRLIIAHTGNTVRVTEPFAGITFPAVASAEAGCDQLGSTCRDKFDNRLNFFAFEFMPQRDPHRNGLY